MQLAFVGHSLRIAKAVDILLNSLKKYECPTCGVRTDGNRHKQPDGTPCLTVWGRRGWRQLGEYDS